MISAAWGVTAVNHLQWPQGAGMENYILNIIKQVDVQLAERGHEKNDMFAPVQKGWDFFFKGTFDLSIIINLKQAFNMTFTRYFVMIMWNFMHLWIFVASRRPFKISKFWETRYQNVCNWERFGGYFNIRDR